MKRDLYFLLAGFLSGIILSIYFYKKRKGILDRLNRLENKITGIEAKDKIKIYLHEISSSMRSIIKNTKGVPLKEKEDILKKVEEKIRKLEEIV